MQPRRIVFALLLVAAGTLAQAQEAPACITLQGAPAVVEAKGTAVFSRITAPAPGFQLGSVAITNLNINHPDAAALKITLSAAPAAGAEPRTADVKLPGAWSSSAGLSAVTFADAAATIQSAAPATTAAITGAFKPATPLSIMTVPGATPSPAGTHEAGRGGSAGVWVLRVSDRGATAATRRIELGTWALELCPVGATTTATAPSPSAANDLLTGLAGAATGAGAPLVSASQGPPEGPTPTANVTAPAANTTVPATNATMPSANVTLPSNATVNGTVRSGNATAAEESDEGLLATLLDRLESLTPAALTNRTRVVDTLFDGLETNSTVRDRVIERLDALTAPWSTVMENANATAAAWVNGTAPTGLTGTTGLRGTGLLLSNTSTVPGLAAWQQGRSNASNETAALRFLDSLRSLLEISGGAPITAAFRTATNTTDAFPVIDALTSAMQQSGMGLNGEATNAIATLMGQSGVMGTGALLGTGRDLEVFNALTNLTKSLGNGPFLKSLMDNQVVDATTSAAQASFRNAAQAAASAVQLGYDYKAGQVQDALAALLGGSNVIKSAITTRLDRYSNAVKAASALVSAAVNTQSQAAITVGESMRSAAKESLQALSQLRPTPARERLIALLQSVDGKSAGLMGVGSNLKATNGILDAAFRAQATQVEAGRNVLAAGLNSGVDKAQLLADTVLGALNSVLSTCISALKDWSKGVGPLAGAKLDIYASGLSYLQTGVTTLKAAIAAVPQFKLDGTLLRAAGQLGLQTVADMHPLTRGAAPPASTPSAPASTTNTSTPRIMDALGSGARGGQVLSLMQQAADFGSVLSSLAGSA